MFPTRILILSDGRPGHYNLSEGIAAAIERFGPARTVRVEVRRGGWSGAALAGLVRARLPARTMLRLVYGHDDARLPPADVIVSAGAETLAANVWLARIRVVPNVFYGSLRLFDPYDFTLVLTSYARNARLPNHVLALKPSRLDPERTAPLPASKSGAPLTLGLLLGGDAGETIYAQADWAALLALPGAMQQREGTRWLVANSRRTPEQVSDAVARLTAEPGSPISRFLDVRTAGAGTLAQVLADCGGVVCTADSSSMISECVWARLPTLAVAPAAFRVTDNERSYREWLTQRGWCRNVPIAGLSPEEVATALAAVTPMTENPQVALAQLLGTRLRLPNTRSADMASDLRATK